jgi:hypothetical protein
MNNAPMAGDNRFPQAYASPAGVQNVPHVRDGEYLRDVRYVPGVRRDAIALGAVRVPYHFLSSDLPHDFINQLVIRS